VTAFLVRRLLALLPLLLGITFMVFLLMYMAPGDFLDQARASRDVSKETIELMERQFGLDEPWYVQYGLWLRNVATLEFGESFAYKIPVLDLIGQRLPATLLLSVTSILFAWCVAIPVAVLAAMKKDGLFDRLSALLAYCALSVPEFFLAILAVFFAAVTGLFPTGGLTSIEYEFMGPGARLLDIARHLVLPTLVLGVGGIAGMMRILRANFIDYLHADFATAARAKGLPERSVLFKHVLRNAINPLLTSLGFAFSSLLSGAVLVENIMNYPGLGRLIFESIMAQDQYVVMAGVVVGCVLLVLGNLLADLLLAWSDPRIKLMDTGGRAGGGGRLRPLPLAAAFLALFGAAWGLSLLPWGEPEFIDGLKAAAKWGFGIFLALLVPAVLWFGAPAFRARIWPQLRRRPLGLFVLGVLGLMYGAALWAPFLSPYPPETQNLGATFHPPTSLVWEDGGLRARVYRNVDPTAAKYVPVEGSSLPLKWFARGWEYRFLGLIPMERHLVQVDTAGLGEGETPPRLYLLGSDGTGRDVFSRLLHGARVSLSIGLVGISITMVLGFLVGGLSGYFGGRFDFLAMRLVEFLMAVPGLYLLLSLRSALAPYFESGEMYFVIIVILSLIGWAGTARVIRGMSLSIRNRSYVLAAESMGQSSGRILVKHLLPNLASYLLVAATLSIPGYILGEAALSFLGLGIQEPSASWGLMLKQAQEDMKVLMLNFWWLLTPGFAIFVTVIAFNVLGDVLRDIVDPRMKTR
jgi:peptide/nickel transport system permease protein